MDQQPPHQPPANQPAQFQPAPPDNGTGMSTGAKVGIGCGAAALVVALLLAIGGYFIYDKVKDFALNPERTFTETVVNNHPDLEDAQFDDEAKTVSVRYAKDGKRYTINYSDVVNGRIEFTDEDGNVTTLGSGDRSQIPEWVPQPGSVSNIVVLFQSTQKGKSSGQYTATASGDLTTLFESLKEELGSAGYSISSSYSTFGDDTGRWEMIGNHEDRQIQLTMIQTNSKGQLTVMWSE